MIPWPPAVVAHRGASAAAPENTLAALRRAAAMGARWAECDVRTSADGVPVVIHDATLDRTTDGRGPVADRTAAELATLDAGCRFDPPVPGEPLPTLAAMLAEAARLGLGLNVEIKAERDTAARTIAAAAAPLVAAWGGPAIVSSFSDAAIAELRVREPTLAVGLLVRRRIGTADIARARDLGATSLHADHRAFTGAAAVARLEAAGLWAAAYTVNDLDAARRLWALGVRTLITDVPDRLLPLAPAA